VTVEQGGFGAEAAAPIARASSRTAAQTSPPCRAIASCRNRRSAGTEVKSLRENSAQLSDAYAIGKGGELFLFNAQIPPYKPAGVLSNHEPKRTRKLLLHRREIAKLEKGTTQKGMTLVVTSIYWKNGRIKFEVGVAKGKKLYDKRETEMRKTIDKETQAQLKERLR